MKRFILAIAALILGSAVWAQPQEGGPWTKTTIVDGITYYEFRGLDGISGAPQEIFVIDWDMSNPSYALRYTWTADMTVTSSVFRRENAVVALNAAYEPESVAVKVGGHMYSCMPKDTVMTTPVPNWKSEGAVFADATGQNVGIAFAGKGMSIQEQREFYASAPWDNLFTSAPMLIDDFNPVGAFYVDSTLTAEQFKEYNYEDPVRHQGVRHPRTAVAITADNHFLMFAVDGRKKGISEGMSARELTRFIERYFHPRYALNMDGGGSTTMCVRGQGDPQTHVVNYPTGNKKHDHAGERRLFSHFCIVEVPQNPRTDVREEVLSDWNKCSGLDCVYDMSPKPATAAPKGYEATYVSHYGRHGSRYAYTAKAYTILLGMLREAEEAENLTPYGVELLSRLSEFWANNEYRMGDLTPLGWQQHQYIAKTMVESFPKAFGKGSVVDAASSPSTRSIVSMASFVSALSRNAPKADVYAHQGMLDVQATRPNQGGHNPFRYKGPESVFPYAESSEEFFLRRFPSYSDVLERMFKDPVKAVGSRKIYDEVFFNLYMLVGGMNSIPEEVRFDVSGLVTPEEYALLWECDNYERLREYLKYRTSCSSIVQDVIDKADARLESGSRGADLRFGHDHVVMALLMIMDIDDFAKYPANPDDLVQVFQTFRSCMATNLQFVFYTPKKCKSGEEPLVKLLLNGEEVRFGSLKPYDGPYYRWSVLKDYLLSRIALFVD